MDRIQALLKKRLGETREPPNLTPEELQCLLDLGEKHVEDVCAWFRSASRACPTREGGVIKVGETAFENNRPKRKFNI